MWNLKHFECWCVKKNYRINLIQCINVITALFLLLDTNQRNKTVNNYPREREKSMKYFCNMYAVTRIIWNALKFVIFYFSQQQRIRVVAKHVHSENMEYGDYDFVENVVEQNVRIARYVIEPWREQNHQRLKSKKLQYSWITYLHLNKIFVYNS